MLNVLIIGPIPPVYGGKSYGGVATHIEGLAKELAKNKHNVTIWNYKLQKDKTYKNISIVGNTYLSYLSIFLFLFTALFSGKKYLSLKDNVLLFYKKHRLGTILNSTKFDVIHVHSVHETAPIVIREILKNDNIRIISTDHGFWQTKKFIVNRFHILNKLKKIARHVNKIIYISDYAYEKHINNDFNQLNKLVKISNPLSSNINRIKIHKESHKKIIFFNGLSESIKRKRLDLVLNTIQQDDFLKNNIKVIAIVNDDGVRYIKNKSFDFEIEYYGPIPMIKVDELYAKSDLMVLPSVSESFGLVYIESLIRGIPIVGFDKVVTEFQELMKCYIGEGYSANNNNCDDLAKKIINVLNYNINSTLIQSKSIEIFSWENKVSEFESIYVND